MEETESSLFENDDHLLVSSLIQFSEDAWRYLVTRIVIPFSRSDKMGIVSIFKRHSMPTDSIISEVFLNLTNNDCAALRNFRYECRFSSYMYMRVYAAAQAVIRKKLGCIPLVLSDMPVGDTLISSADGYQGIQVEEHLEQANKMLAKLWKENSMYAFVLLLRHDLKLATDEISDLLGKSKANVDQIHHRAQKRMIAFRRENNE